MYINPDSRGQCVLGEVKLVSSLINSIQSSFLSSWSTLGSRNVCPAFPKTGCLLGVNQRDTRRSERPLICLYVCLHAFSSICVYVFICTFVEDGVFFYFTFHCYGLQYLSYKTLKPFLADWLTNQQRNHVATRRPAWSVSRVCCQTACRVGRRLATGPDGLPWRGRCRDTPSHTVLSLFCYLLINQNQVSLWW